MSIDEWREKYARFGLPNFVAVESSPAEVNCLPDAFVPSVSDTALGRQLQREVQPGTFDGVKIEDMKDTGFAAGRFAANRLAAIDASIKYGRQFVGNYKRVTASLKAGRFKKR